MDIGEGSCSIHDQADEWSIFQFQEFLSDHDQKISEFESVAKKLLHCAAMGVGGTSTPHVMGLMLLLIPHHNILSLPFYLFMKPDT